MDEIKSRQLELKRIERVTSIEKTVLGFDIGGSETFDGLDALVMMNLRTRMTRLKEKFGRTFKTEISGNAMTITRLED